MKRLNLLLTPLALSLFLVAITGCSVEGQVEERSYDVKVTSGADEAKALLENYSSGTSVGSEADGFDILIKKIKEESPEQAAVYEEALNAITAKPRDRASIAKKALEKLSSATPAAE